MVRPKHCTTRRKDGGFLDLSKQRELRWLEDPPHGEYPLRLGNSALLVPDGVEVADAPLDVLLGLVVGAFDLVEDAALVDVPESVSGGNVRCCASDGQMKRASGMASTDTNILLDNDCQEEETAFSSRRSRFVES